MFGCNCVYGQVCLCMWVCMFHTLGFCFVGISPIQTCACVCSHTHTHTHTESIGYIYDLKDVSVFDDLTFQGRLFQTDGAAYEKDL